MLVWGSGGNVIDCGPMTNEHCRICDIIYRRLLHNGFFCRKVNDAHQTRYFRIC